VSRIDDKLTETSKNWLVFLTKKSNFAAELKIHFKRINIFKHYGRKESYN